MRQLFEYLISKENKDKVIMRVMKRNLSPGAIMKIKSLGWMVYITFDTLVTIKNAKISSYSQKLMTKYNGGFISYNEGVEDYNYMGLDSYDENLKNDSYGFDVEEVYPGELPFKEISEYTESNIEKEAKKRKGIKV